MFRNSFSTAFRSTWRAGRQYSVITKPLSSNFIGYSLVAGLSAAGAFLTLSSLNNAIRLDAPSPISTPLKASFIQPDTKSNPFPTEFKYDEHDFSLLGVGVRTVSLFGIHVYAVGVYIANADKAKVKEVLGPNVSESDLLDPETGAVLVSMLLKAGVRLDIRIVPVRNTDFGHLRDGLVRTIMASPRFKAESNDDESVGEGISELKRVFGRKLAFQKNKVLHLNRDKDGVLRADYFQTEKEDDASPLALGEMRNAKVSELLFLQYLSGPKPSSESTRREVVKTLSQLTR